MIDFTDTDIGRKNERHDVCLWREQVIADSRKRGEIGDPPRKIPRRRRTLLERIRNAYCRFVGRHYY